MVVGVCVEVGIDEGLCVYMLGVYNYMIFGFVLIGFFVIGIYMMVVVINDVGQVVGLIVFGNVIYGSLLKWVVMFVLFGMVMWLFFCIQLMSVFVVWFMFLVYVVVMGIFLFLIFLVFIGGLIVCVFFIIVVFFGVLSIFGYIIKKDLFGWGNFLFMGLIGIIIVLFVNIFMVLFVLQFVIFVIGVLVFVGLIVYDIQQIKEMYYEGDSLEVVIKKLVMGVLCFYLDFINFFLMLLQLFGNCE